MRTLFLYQTSALKCTSAFSTNNSRTLSQTCLPVEKFASPAGNNPYRWLWNRANYKIKLNKAGGTQGFITDFKLMASYSNTYSTLMHFLAVGSELQMFKLLFTRGIRKTDSQKWRGLVNWIRNPWDWLSALDTVMVRGDTSTCLHIYLYVQGVTRYSQLITSPSWFMGRVKDLVRIACYNRL